MAQDFSKCEQCGIIFLNPGNAHQTCPKCRNEEETAACEQDVLRLLKNTLRDHESRGELLTISSLADCTGVPERTIWEFIHQGEIDTAAMDDPEVRQYVARRRLERERSLQKQSGKPPSAAGGSANVLGAEKRTGYHSKRNDK